MRLGTPTGPREIPQQSLASAGQEYILFGRAAFRELNPVQFNVHESIQTTVTAMPSHVRVHNVPGSQLGHSIPLAHTSRQCCQPSLCRRTPRWQGCGRKLPAHHPPQPHGWPEQVLMWIENSALRGSDRPSTVLTDTGLSLYSKDTTMLSSSDTFGDHPMRRVGCSGTSRSAAEPGDRTRSGWSL